ncbi:MAG: methyltransferase domain-containing protein [Candidatus Thorarchaeota archaeon]
MAVAFMAALEQSPETYDKEFNKVLGGRQVLIRERLLELVKPGMRVLDLGCGPGSFTQEASRIGAEAVGVDSSEIMIKTAQKNSAQLERSPVYFVADALEFLEILVRNLSIPNGGPAYADVPQLNKKYDFIVSSFLLSELKPHQRELLLQGIGLVLNSDGIFGVASETLPEKGSARNNFWKQRSKAQKLANKKLMPPVEKLESITETSGLKITAFEKYGPEISLVLGKIGDNPPQSVYENRQREFQGVRARSRIWYDHLTGGWRGIPLPAGLYRAGNPSKGSPVVVTANYELTYYTVMRALAKDSVDAWVLVCDTNGINVWCAARGKHFHTSDVVEMVKLTQLEKVVDHREIILPQLSAAGMDTKEIRQRTGFRSRYGPVRIQDLKKWLDLDKPRPKPRDMATVTFNLRERMEQTVAHIPFLLAVLLGRPLAVLLGSIFLINVVTTLFLQSLSLQVFSVSLAIVIFIIEIFIALYGNAIILGLIFPILPAKGNSFLRRGLGLAAITLPFAFILMFLLGAHWTEYVVWSVAQFVMAVSLTMDWSGMTSVSDPKVIEREYPYMIYTIFVGIVIIIGFNIIVSLMGW